MFEIEFNYRFVAADNGNQMTLDIFALDKNILSYDFCKTTIETNEIN